MSWALGDGLFGAITATFSNFDCSLLQQKSCNPPCKARGLLFQTLRPRGGDVDLGVVRQRGTLLPEHGYDSARTSLPSIPEPLRPTMRLPEDVGLPLPDLCSRAGLANLYMAEAAIAISTQLWLWQLWFNTYPHQIRPAPCWLRNPTMMSRMCVHLCSAASMAPARVACR